MPCKFFLPRYRVHVVPPIDAICLFWDVDVYVFVDYACCGYLIFRKNKKKSMFFFFLYMALFGSSSGQSQQLAHFIAAQ